MPPASSGESDQLSRAVARVEPTTIVLGLCAVAYELAVAGWRAGLALALGAAISWLNYRWLRRAVLALAPAASADAAGEADHRQAARASRRALLKFLVRLALLLAALYVILTRLTLPRGPLLAGLFAAVAAVLLQMIDGLVRGAANHGARSGD